MASRSERSPRRSQQRVGRAARTATRQQVVSPHIRASDHLSRQARLEQLLRQQGAELWERKQSLRESLPTGVMDDADVSWDAEELGVGSWLLELTSQTVQGIEGALQRLEAGDYGNCSECRCRITDARLRALPFAALCLACQEKQDGRAAAAHGPSALPGRIEF